MSTTVNVPSIDIADGVTIPQLGYGCWEVPAEKTAQLVGIALDQGYRHIDTAQMYGNEAGVGEAVTASGLARDEIFITSKLNNSKHEPDDARRSFDETLAKLQTDHVDLFLIHWPLPTRYGGDFVKTWKVLEEFKADGRARAIGVSNFEPDHLDRLAAEADVKPAVNQIEVHPYFRNQAAVNHGGQAGIVTEAWSPLAHGGLIGEESLSEIASRHGKSVPQVVLRWHIEKGYVIFPKSESSDHMQSNLELFDFELTPEDHLAIDALDRGEDGRTGPNPNTFDMIG